MTDSVDYQAKLANFPELRGCAGWRAIGLPVTTRNDEAAKLLDLSFRAAFTRSAPRYHGLDPAQVAAAAAHADSSCPMAYIAALALRCIGGSKTIVQPALAEASACAAGGSCSAWERRHLHAVSEYASADDNAVGNLYTAIVQDYPFDTLAISLAFIHNSPARRASLLQNSGAAMEAWAAPATCTPGDLYPFLLAEHAYSLGENERYEESERLAQLALEMEPTCALATHQSEMELC